MQSHYTLYRHKQNTHIFLTQKSPIFHYLHHHHYHLSSSCSRSRLRLQLRNYLTHYILEKLVPTCGGSRRRRRTLSFFRATLFAVMLFHYFLAGIFRTVRCCSDDLRRWFLWIWNCMSWILLLALAPIALFYLRLFSVVVATIPEKNERSIKLNFMMNFSDDDWEEEMDGTYECWKRLRHLLQRKSLSGKPTSPHMQQTVWWSTIVMVWWRDRESESCDDGREKEGNLGGESERVTEKEEKMWSVR